MVATPGLTVIDTPIFVIDLRYKRDRHFPTNRAFLAHIAKEERAATTIFNLLEVCGILSFNLKDEQLKEMFHYFPQHYNVDVLPHSTLESRSRFSRPGISSISSRKKLASVTP